MLILLIQGGEGTWCPKTICPRDNVILEIICRGDNPSLLQSGMHLGTPHLPYIAVLKSVHRTATICSSIHTFFRGSKLLTVAVLWTIFGVFKKCSFGTGFPQLRKVSIKLPPFAVLGHNSEK